MSSLVCPKCSETLIKESNRLFCANNHSYDIAKQGYINLLLANQKKSKQPGDTMDMVQTRAAFLNEGYYEPIAQLLTQSIGSPRTLLDIGCGEGYYTHYMAHHLASTLEQPTEILGLDISRDAIKQASRRNKSIQWLVASGINPPIKEQSMDCITSLFTPLMPKGYLHALAPEGEVFTLYTTGQHLLELRSHIYDEVLEESYDPKPEMLEAGFICKEETALHFHLQLSSSCMIKNLLMMTPHRWKVTPEKLAKLDNLTSLDTQADIMLYRFKKA